VSRLVIVVPLKDGARKHAEELLEQGPPFDLDKTHLKRHEVLVTDHEVIFSFETAGTEPPIELEAEDPTLHAASLAWHEVMAGAPRKARQVFSWERDS
jgi:hypothetical protein